MSYTVIGITQAISAVVTINSPATSNPLVVSEVLEGTSIRTTERRKSRASCSLQLLSSLWCRPPPPSRRRPPVHCLKWLNC